MCAKRIALPYVRRLLCGAAIAASLSLTGCDRAPEKHDKCLAGLWVSEQGYSVAVNIRNDASMRVTAKDGLAWILERASPSRWVGTEGVWPGSGSRVVLDGRCESGVIKLSPGTSNPLVLRKVDLDEQAIRFSVQGASLSGRLLMPKGQIKAPVVVFVHGSEKQSALETKPHQYLLPAMGIGVFIYDKRGTGTSAGNYTQNFELLANDAARALQTAHKLAGPRLQNIGYFGGSQGAWVAPLAALKGQLRPDFIIAAYGLAQPPIEEDVEEVMDDLRRHGFDNEAALDKARELCAATAEIMLSNFSRGFERLDRLKGRFGGEPWYPFVEGEFTGDFLSMPSWLLAIVGPMLNEGTSWNFQPMPVLTRLKQPMLWILGGRDSEAPIASTFPLLQKLQAQEPAQLDIAIYPQAEHSIMRFKTVQGKPIPLGPARSYFELLGHWINTRSLPLAPDVELHLDPAPPVER